MQRPRTNSLSRIMKLTSWLIDVASAAPDMPMFSPNMNSGSSTIFSMPPVHSPHMASVAMP